MESYLEGCLMLNIKSLVVHLPKSCLYMLYYSNVQIASDCTWQNGTLGSFAAVEKQTPEPNITTIFFLFDLSSLGRWDKGCIMCWNLSILCVSDSLRPSDAILLVAPFTREGEEKNTKQVFLTWKTAISSNSQGEKLENFRFWSCLWEINLGNTFASHNRLSLT